MSVVDDDDLSCFGPRIRARAKHRAREAHRDHYRADSVLPLLLDMYFNTCHETLGLPFLPNDLVKLVQRYLFDINDDDDDSDARSEEILREFPPGPFVLITTNRRNRRGEPDVEYFKSEIELRLRVRRIMLFDKQRGSEATFQETKKALLQAQTHAHNQHLSFDIEKWYDDTLKNGEGEIFKLNLEDETSCFADSTSFLALGEWLDYFDESTGYQLCDLSEH